MLIPYISVERAISKGKSAFFARVISIREFLKYKYFTEAEMNVEMLERLYGVNINKKIITIRFRIDTIRDFELPVNFKVSETYLFVFWYPINYHIIDFRCHELDGMDFAFVVPNIWLSTVNYEIEKGAIPFESIYEGTFKVKKEEFYNWVKMRSKK